MSSSPKALQIDPGYPVVWEDTTTIRVGFERTIARVAAPSPTAQSLVAQLIRGATTAELAACATRLKEAMLTALEPALLRPDDAPAMPCRVRSAMPSTQSGAPPLKLRRAPLGPASPSLGQAARDAFQSRLPRSNTASRVTDGIEIPQSSVRTRISDDGRALPWLRAALEADSMCSFERAATPPDLAVEVIRYLEPLGRTSRWLGAGVPQLLIRFTDASVKVGPLIAADGAPCHGCETLHLTDADPALPAIAAQLYGDVPSTETAEVGHLLGAAAAYFVQAWRRKEAWVHDHQVSIPIAHGRVDAVPRVTQIPTHPGCSCALTDEPRPPQRTATAAEQYGQRSQTLTTEARRAHE